MTRLPVLSLWQPHATLVVAPDPRWNNEAAKVCETRSWKPFLQLPFTAAVHAAKRYDAENRHLFMCEPFASTLKRCGFYPGDPRPLLKRHEIVETLDGSKLRPLPLGAIVGTVEVLAVMTTTEWLESRHEYHTWEEADRFEQERAFGFYGPSRFAWVLREPRMLPVPIAFSGRQEALYALDDRTQALLDEQLGRVAA